MSAKGWYPDPGGREGWFRYWNGSAWSAELTQSPADPPPGSQRAGGLSTSQPAFRTTPAASAAKGRQGRGVGPVLVIVGLVLLALLAVLGVRAVAGDSLNPFGPKTDAMPTQDVCPKPALDNTPAPHPQDGRVHGGKVSYPMLPRPWSAPHFDDRVPFGVDVREQVVTIHPDYEPGQSWVASVLVGDLVAGDGFYTPQKGTEIIAHCVLGTFYGDNEVRREDKAARSMTIDGHEAYMLEMHLTFDIPKLDEKGETAIIIVIATGTSSASLYYASIPDSQPQLLTVARQVVSTLKVDK